jgi:hypothetical protein
MAERRWQRLRSEHARTLAGLERAVLAHPSGQTPATGPAAQARNVTIVPRGGDAA